MSFSTCLTGKTNLDTNSDTVVISPDDLIGKNCKKKELRKNQQNKKSVRRKKIFELYPFVRKYEDNINCIIIINIRSLYIIMFQY